MNILDEIAPELPPEPPRSWSPMQQAIFEAVQDPHQPLLFEGVAGCGKTSTIKECTKHTSGSSIFLAFNKAIADEIRGSGVQAEVKTLNALGHGLMLRERPQAKLNPRKTLEILKKIMGDTSDFKDFGYTLSRVIGLGKNQCLGISSSPEAEAFAEIINAYAFDIPVDRLDSMAGIAAEAFAQSTLNEAEFDFDDQLWVPLLQRWEFPHFDNAFIDECQDLSPIQHLMAEALAVRGARIVGVGDRCQAIYGFRGASHGSMDQLKSRFGMISMPLSVSYRCSEEVVKAAQEFCPQIRARTGAPTGGVLSLNQDPQDFNQFMVLCRNNAPLFREILRYVRRKQPVRVLSSFLDSFQGFIKGFKTIYTNDLRVKLDRWYDKESSAAKAKNQRGKLAGIIDRYETIKLLSRDYKYTEDLVRMVKSLGESTRGPIFATVHKSKGLESNHVYCLRPDLFGGYGDLTPEQLIQEDNLHYVALTRAAETFTYGAEPRY